MKGCPKKKKLIKEEEGEQKKPGKQVTVRAISRLSHFSRRNYLAYPHKHEALLLVFAIFSFYLEHGWTHLKI